MRRLAPVLALLLTVAPASPASAHHRGDHDRGGGKERREERKGDQRSEAGAASSDHDDSACATDPVSWADDPCAGRQWGLQRIGAPQAWSAATGSGVTVAVLDTGADFGHPDLSANLIARSGSDLLRNTSYVCPWQKAGPNARSSSAIAQDDNGHGTHVSGIVAAVTDNGTGVAGAAPDAKVLPVKVLDDGGSGSDRDVARGICFAADAGADVVNLSLGFDPVVSIVVSGLGNETEQAIEYAYGRGSAVVVAAGNESFPACDFPASHTKVLCVGATDSNDVKAWYSNFGSNLGVVAPGGAGSVFCHHSVDVWSTIWPASDLDCDGDGYDTLGGTSMAAPHAAAVAALVVDRFGSAATPDFVYQRLKSTADDLGPPGTDPFYGHGRVNAARAAG